MYKIRNFSLIFIFTMVKDKVIQVYAPNINAKEAERFYDDIQDFLELTPKNDVLFITELECKVLEVKRYLE